MVGGTGPAKAGTTGRDDVFSISHDPLMGLGLSAVASMWLMPWRAAAVVASEAMKDSMRGWR